jgi:DNA polymerase-3 subunit gamma/tau
MATIADRCQRFDFQRPSLEQISEVLQRVAAAEGIEVDDGAVATIARSASGSFRDALGTLDQLVAFGGEEIALDDVLQLLGAADAELLFGAVDAVIAEDPKAVLLGVEEMARSGRDPAQFARDLLAHLRHLLVSQTVGEVPNTFVVTATDEGRLSAQAQAIGAATLVRTIDELSAALTAVREGDDARMAVEIALLKAARPDLDPSTEGLLRRIERLEQGPGAPRAAGPVGAGDPPPPAVAKASSGVVPPTPPPAAGESEPDAADLDRIVKAWPAVLDQLLQTAPALAATFEGARPVGFDANERTVTIGFPSDHTFNKRKAEAPDKREQMAAALESVLGEKLRPVYTVLEGDAASETAAEAGDGVDHEALMEKIKSEFDAEEVG